MNRPRVRRHRRARTPAARIFGESEASLLDVVDNVLNRGVMLTGEAMLGVANVDLIYLRLSALLCAADRVFPDLESARPARRR